MFLNSVIFSSIILFQVLKITIVQGLIVKGYSGFTKGVAIAPSYDGNNTIYLLGGDAGVRRNSLVFHQIWAYTVDTAQFSVLQKIPRGNVLTTAIDSKGNIYYFTNLIDSVSSLYKFTAQTRNVKLLREFRNLEISVTYCSALIVDSIYFLATELPEAATIRLYKYNSASDSIRRTSPFSQILINSSILWDGNHIYVLGGTNMENVDNKDIIKINSITLSFETLPVKMSTGITSNVFVVENTAIFFNEDYDLVFGDMQRLKMTIESLKYQFIEKVFPYFSFVYVKKRNAIYIFTCQGRIRGCAVLTIDMNFMVEEKEEVVLISSNISLPCEVSKAPKLKMTWKKNHKLINGKRLVLLENGVLNIASVEFDDAGIYTCFVTNVFGNSTSNIQLAVKHRTEIRAWGPNKPISLGENAEFSCMAYTDETLPSAKIMWFKDEKPIHITFKSRLQRRPADALLLLNAVESDSGNYTCVAETNLDTTNTTVLLLVQNSSIVEIVGDQDSEPTFFAYSFLLPLVLIIFAIIVIGISILTYCLCKYNKESRLSREELRAFKYGSSFKENETMEVYTNAQPYNSSYELPLNAFEIHKNVVLGEGEFGIVYKGVVHSEIGKQDVAFKTTKPSTTDHQLATKQLKSLLSELKVMIYIGDHPNVAKLVGAYTRQLKSGVVCVAAELCVNGNLERLLRSSDFVEKIIPVEKDGGEYVRRQVTLSMLINWSLQIAKGMEYVSSKKIIHSDLATRNVLVTGDMSIRITDFGLSRRMENYTNYVKMGTEPLPWRWMAVESLDVMSFSSQSDVWSFGVTLWEIWSMGSIPYPGISWTSDFVKKLKHGDRLPQPQYASLIMYQKMEECWKLEPTKRPTFSQLVKFFQNIVYKEEKIVYLNTRSF